MIATARIRLSNKLNLFPCENQYAYSWPMPECSLIINACVARRFADPDKSIKFIESLIKDLELRRDIIKLRYLL